LSVRYRLSSLCFFFFQAEDGIRDFHVTGVQTCALPISWLEPWRHARPPGAVRGRPRAARPAQPALVASRSLPRADAGRWGPSARPAPVLVQEHAHRDEDGQRVTLRSEEHTSELQSRENLVCRLLLEKKKAKRYNDNNAEGFI